MEHSKDSASFTPRDRIFATLSLAWMPAQICLGCGLYGTDPPLELDGLIHLAALRTTGAVDVRVIGVNVSTTPASENAIFARRRVKASPSQFRIDGDAG